MSARKASHGTIFLIVSSGSPLALIASSRRSTSKKPFCPMTRSLHPPATAGGQRVRFATTWRDEFFEVPSSLYRKLSYDAIADFAPVSLVTRVEYFMFVPNSSPAHSLKEFVDYVRSRPGQLTMASPGTGSAPYLAEMLRSEEHTSELQSLRHLV